MTQHRETGSTGPSQVAVVTGAAQGIGRAITQALADRGFCVLAVDRDAERLADLSRDIPGAEPFIIDLTDPGAAAACRQAGEQKGQVTAWVNNAAIMKLGALHEVQPQEIDEMLSVNLRAVVSGTQEAVRSFLQSGTAGSIVNISSIHAKAAFPGYALYDTCKGGVESLTRYVCVEYGHLGIRCNAVAPGAVLTPASIRLSEQASDPEAEFAATRQLSPMGRISEPAEIAAMVAFLLSPAAVAVNGHVLAADNGMAARAASFPPPTGIIFGPRPRPN